MEKVGPTQLSSLQESISQTFRLDPPSPWYISLTQTLTIVLKLSYGLSVILCISVPSIPGILYTLDTVQLQGNHSYLQSSQIRVFLMTAFRWMAVKHLEKGAALCVSLNGGIWTELIFFIVVTELIFSIVLSLQYRNGQGNMKFKQHVCGINR